MQKKGSNRNTCHSTLLFSNQEVLHLEKQRVQALREDASEDERMVCALSPERKGSTKEGAIVRDGECGGVKLPCLPSHLSR